MNREANWKPPQGSDEFGLRLLGRHRSSSPKNQPDSGDDGVFFPRHNHCNMSPLDTKRVRQQKTCEGFYFSFFFLSYGSSGPLVWIESSKRLRSGPVLAFYYFFLPMNRLGRDKRTYFIISLDGSCDVARANIGSGST